MNHQTSLKFSEHARKNWFSPNVNFVKLEYLRKTHYRAVNAGNWLSPTLSHSNDSLWWASYSPLSNLPPWLDLFAKNNINSVLHTHISNYTMAPSIMQSLQQEYSTSFESTSKKQLLSISFGCSMKCGWEWSVCGRCASPGYSDTVKHPSSLCPADTHLPQDPRILSPVYCRQWSVCEGEDTGGYSDTTDHYLPSGHPTLSPLWHPFPHGNHLTFSPSTIID